MLLLPLPLLLPLDPLLPCCCWPVGVVMGLRLCDWDALLSFAAAVVVVVALLTSLAREEGWIGDADFLDRASPLPPRDEFRGETRPV